MLHPFAGLLSSFALAVALFPLSAPPAARAAEAAPALTRLAGDDRIATAVTASRTHWTRADDAVLASAGDFPDALSGAALAAELDAPLLLTPSTGLPEAVRAELDRLGPRRVHVLGGPRAVPAGVLAAVEALGVEVERISGPDRFATAAAVAGITGAGPRGEVALALGLHERAERAWPDAVSAAGLSAGGGAVPTLLATTGGVPETTLAALRTLRPDEVLLVGGTGSLGPGIAAEVEALGLKVRRLAGPSRYETALAVAREALTHRRAEQVVLASGATYADALAAGALTPKTGPLLLVPVSPPLPDGVDDLLREDGWKGALLIGGPKAVGSGTEAWLKAALAGEEPPPPPAAPQGGAFRAFHSASWWNRPLPAGAPRHPNSDAMIALLGATNVSGGCVHLSGPGPAEGNWGMPIYWADASSPTHDVTSRRYAVPPEFSRLRIPAGVRQMPTSDGELVIYDRERGWVAELSAAHWDGHNWSVEGGSIAYLASNGIDGRFPESDDKRNSGTFRGYNGAVAAVRHDEVKAGVIPHVLKLGVRVSNRASQFPLWGSDGQSQDTAAPPQGARIRIKPGIDLGQYGLHPEARVIAEALQRYGAIIGDTTGAPIELKLQATSVEGRGDLWSIDAYALCRIPINAFEFVAADYRP